MKQLSLQTYCTALRQADLREAVTKLGIEENWQMGYATDDLCLKDILCDFSPLERMETVDVNYYVGEMRVNASLRGKLDFYIGQNVLSEEDRSQFTQSVWLGHQWLSLKSVSKEDYDKSLTSMKDIVLCLSEYALQEDISVLLEFKDTLVSTLFD